MPRVDRITYDDFGDGIDRRGGVIGRSAKKFELIENGIVTEGRKVAMRPPLLRYTGDLERTHSQGCDYLNGRILTVAARDQTVVHTTADTDTHLFDIPEGSTTWELLEMVVYQETSCALVRHYFPASVLCPYRNYLHVFDAARPTYTEDPEMPQSWAPAFPTQPYGEGKVGAYLDYRPRLAVIGERLTMTTAGGDVAQCAVGLPRVWNRRTPAEILANGEMFYRILDASALSQSFTIPVVHADLITEQRYAAYVCEYLLPTGVWAQFTEVVSVDETGEYSLASETNRFNSLLPAETRITVRHTGTPDGTLIRFRAIADCPATIVSGLNLTANVVSGQLTVEGGNMVGGVLSHEGKSYNIQTTEIPTLEDPGESVLVAVPVPGAPVAIPTIVASLVAPMGLNGQQRYWSRLVASITGNGNEQQRDGDVYCMGKFFNGPTGRGFVGFSKLNYDKGGTIFGDAAKVVGLNIGDILRIDDCQVKIEAIHPSGFRYGNVFLGGTARNEVVEVSAISGNFNTLFYTAAAATPKTMYVVGFNGGYTYAIDGRTAITVGGTRLDGAGTLYTEDLKVGKNVEVNGEVRKVISITSDTVAEVELPFTSAGSFIALRDPRYEYAGDVGETGNDWYATKEANITLKGSGTDDAVWLGTSNYDDSGQQPVAVAAMQNRMLVQYPSQMQLWAVGPSTADYRLLALMGQGAGENSRPEPALIDGYAGLPTINGPRLFAPQSDGKDYIDFIAVGDMLRGEVFPDLTRAVWWPRLRCWVTCAGSGADLRLFVLSVHKDNKVLAWSVWTLPASITTVDSLFTRGIDLALQSGTSIYYFDAESASFIDFDGSQVVATFRWIYNDLGHPHRNKKVITIDLVQTGKSTISIFTNPRTKAVLGTEADKVQAATVKGDTVGLQRVPVMVMGPGVALEIESSDPTGYLLDQVGFDYTLLNR